MSPPVRYERGFTLLEVLVALAILAIAMAAILKAAAEGAANAGYLRDQTLAVWVASNKINEVLLESDWPAEGNSRGVSEMAGREWRWELAVSRTSDPDLRRLDISVWSRDGASPLGALTAFKGRPR